MIATLSPAKTLDHESPTLADPATQPRFAAEAATLARSAANLTQKRLRSLMHISNDLARLNAGRFRAFEHQADRPAIRAFAGDVYVGFDAATLDTDALAFAQDHVRIISGLYGLLRPYDAIRPHRLEMGTRWAPRRKRLTDWWGNRIATLLIDDLDRNDGNVILNLASQEYWAAIDGRLPDRVRVIEIDFRESDGRFVSFHAKKARGMMARWLVEHRVDRIAAMKDFDSAGYAFDTDASEGDQWTFTRV